MQAERLRDILGGFVREVRDDIRQSRADAREQRAADRQHRREHRHDYKTPDQREAARTARHDRR